MWGDEHPMYYERTIFESPQYLIFSNNIRGDVWISSKRGRYSRWFLVILLSPIFIRLTKEIAVYFNLKFKKCYFIKKNWSAEEAVWVRVIERRLCNSEVVGSSSPLKRLAFVTWWSCVWLLGRTTQIANWLTPYQLGILKNVFVPLVLLVSSTTACSLESLR